MDLLGGLPPRHDHEEHGDEPSEAARDDAASCVFGVVVGDGQVSVVRSLCTVVEEQVHTAEVEVRADAKGDEHHEQIDEDFSSVVPLIACFLRAKLAVVR